MLKPSPKYFGSRSGQAMIEFLPAIVLFFIIIVVSLVFFIGMRESTYMQEAARNALFAKIANSGPLISPPDRQGVVGQYVFPLAGARNVAVTNDDTCFSAIPSGGTPILPLPKVLGVSMDLSRVHKMTIFRRPGAPTLCN